ncbi:MAG TPA: ABC transporter permease [Dehalococcoidia bacterium]|nr:ABC transporter permease [Dehalococcoidia bacterium]
MNREGTHPGTGAILGLPESAGDRRLARYLQVARANPLGVFGGVLILVLIVVGILAPAIAPYPIDKFAGVPIKAPSAAHLFGTDKFGRDIFSRVVHGARISLEVGFFSVILGTLVGMIIGTISGYAGGLVDAVIQRSVDTAIAFPQLILLLIVIRVLGPSIVNVILVIAIGIVPGVARVVRGAVLSEARNAYVEAARATGASGARIVGRHLVPNVLPLTIVIATTLLGTAILAEASLSFLGLGITPPNPSWGADISAARNSFPINTWSALFPGIAISLTVLGFNLLGDALRDILDPRLRGSR